MVPVKVMVASEVPSPTLKVSPVVPDRVVVPLVLTSWTCTGLEAASASLMEMRLPLPEENTSADADVDCTPGALLTGASLTAVRVMVRLAVLLLKTPSLAARVTVRVVVSGLSLLLL
jgi:hypothetical protein